MKLDWRLATLKNGIQDAMAYRTEFFLEFGAAALVPAAFQWVLWNAMFRIGGHTEVAGMTYNDMIHYTLASVLFNQIRGGDLDFEMAEMIRNGQLSNYLLRPVSVVEFLFLRGIAPKLFIVSLSLIVGLLGAHWAGLSPMRLVSAMALALMGHIIHYQFSTALAATAFYWEEAYSVLMVKNMIVSLLSGELLPLNLFPESVSWIWKSTPFYLYVFGPTQYALGRWSHTQFLEQLLIAGLWMLLGWVAIRLTWGRGIKRYLSLGG